MKIAIIVNSLSRKGPVIVAKEITEGLIENNIYVKVFYLKNIKEVEFPCEVEKFSINSIKKFKEFDVLHSHSLRPDILALLMKIFYRKRIVTTIHNICDTDLSLIYNKHIAKIVSVLWKLTWVFFDKKVSLTKFAQNHYKNNIPHLKTDIIYNAPPEIETFISPKDHEIILHLKKNFKIIGTNAVLTKRKNIQLLIESLSLLPNHILIIVGDGEEKNTLQNLASELKVDHRVFFFGFKKNATAFLSYYDFYAIPSFSEGMPLSMLEAAQAGIPILCSDIEIFREIFTEDEVYFFPKNSPKIFSEILNNKDFDIKAEKAKIKTEKQYSKKSMISKYINIYKELLK